MIDLKPHFITVERPYKEGTVEVFEQEIATKGVKKAELAITALGVYEAEIDGELVPDAAERFASGLTLRDGTECRPATLEQLPDGRVRVTLHEGKYHQVKRMIAACGATVTYLKRVQLGNVRLDESLAPGEFRELAAEELASLRPPDA